MKVIVIVIVVGLVLIGAAVTDGQPRFAGGTDAAVQNYPFAAAILYGGQLFGNGAVIGRFFVLTSASALHVTETSGYSVTVGVSNYQDTQRRIQVQSIYRHPEWIGWDDNLAVLGTDPIAFSNYIKPIPIASSSPDEMELTFVSFGMNSAGTSVKLQHGQFRGFGANKCHNLAHLGPAAPTVESGHGYCVIAALGTPAKGFFADDSGAPGVANNQLHAIFAFTAAKGGLEDVGIAMRVPKYNGWIESVKKRFLQYR